MFFCICIFLAKENYIGQGQMKRVLSFIVVTFRECMKIAKTRPAWSQVEYSLSGNLLFDKLLCRCCGFYRGAF